MDQQNTNDVKLNQKVLQAMIVKNEKTEQKLDKKILKVMIIPMILAIIIEIFYRICIERVKIDSVSSFSFAIILCYIVYMMILAIVKKATRATNICGVIIFALLTINQLKIVYTAEPLYFSDINFMGKASELATMVFSYNVYSIIKYVVPFLTLLLMLILISECVKDIDFEVTNLKARITMFCVSGAILLLLFIPNDYTKKVYLQAFFNTNELKDYAHYTTNYLYYRKYGLLPGMYGVMLNNRFSEPKDYNKEKLDELLAEASKNDVTENWGKPNILVIFSESFWNVDQLEEVEFDKEVAKNFNEFKAQGKCIDLLSCAYGGMSENVAFELLTGGKLHYFSRGYIPIMSLYKKEEAVELPSIVKELGNNGYTSKIVFGKDYYNSRESFLRMGFDEYSQVKQETTNKKGNYVSDEYLTDLMIEALQNKEAGTPLFYMTETIQNHMPYNLSRFTNYDISIKNSNLDEGMNNALLSYSQGVYDADQQLKRIYDYIQEYEEPTLIIFLGDHLPYIYANKGDNVIDNLDYINVEDELEKNYRKYNTNGLILANFEIDYESVPKYLSNDMFLTYIINHMDIEISDYYKWLYSTIDELPASNTYVSLDENGQIYATNNLQNEMAETNKLKEHMQYRFLIEPTK